MMVDANKVSTNELYKAYYGYIKEYFGYELSGEEYKRFIKYCVAEREKGNDVAFNPFGMCAYCFDVSTDELWKKMKERRVTRGNE